MTHWRPAERDDVDAIVSGQLQACSPALRQLFDQIRITTVSAQIERLGRIGQVFAVARRGSSLLFFEDVEEGFEWSRPDSDGVIRSFGASQFELTHILTQLRDEAG